MATSLEERSPGLLSEQKTVISKRRRLDERVASTHPRGFGDIGMSLEGKRLGHFELQECIGGGGMGVVFRGLDTTLGRTVAVKVVSNDTTDEETLRRFRNEAQSAARLDHPNIARVYYVGEDSGWNYIVFEYIDGVNIRDLVHQRGPLPLEDVVSYTLQVAEALGHAAQRDVVHRDIKPSNILVMADGRAKLVDMGLARLHQVESNANDLTATGVTLGTFDYISPEQARDPRTADVRSDLYSLGCTFYFMLTGLPPFPEGTVLQKLLNHSSEPPRDPREVRGDLPEEIVSIALRLMAKQPGQRFQHPQELVAALLLACDRLGIAAGVTPAPVWLGPRSTWWDFLERHVPWALPTLLLVLAVCAVEWLQGRDPVTHAEMQPRAGAMSPPHGDERPSNAVPFPPNGNAVDSSQGSNGPAERRADSSPRPAPGVARPEPPPALASAPTLRTETAAAERGDEDAPESWEKLSGQALSETYGASATNEVRAVPQQVRRPVTSWHTNVLIVRPGAYRDDTSNIVDSLEAALQRIAASPEFSVIELLLDQAVEQPRTIQLPARTRELTIRAGEGYRPVLIFRPDAFGLGPERRMLNIVGGNLALEGLHLRVELPNDMSESWSLIHLNQVESLSLRNCTATIVNPYLNRAAFITVGGPVGTGWESAAAPPAARTPEILLENCVARGQAALVRADQGLPFWLTWRQGFLATTESLVESAGLSRTAVDDVIRLHLENVTASLDGGLVRLDLRNSGNTTMPELGIDSHHCAFVHPRHVPLVDYAGLDDLQLALKQFEMGGEDNFYDFTETRWRLVAKGGEMWEFAWEDQHHAWYKEKRAERGLRWRQPLPTDRDVTVRLPRDYLLEPTQSRLAGFDDLERLPLVP